MQNQESPPGVSQPAKRSILPTGLLILLLVVPLAYVLTLARTVVFGDPTEYTFVANILGIAHPPGYAFYTLLGKLIQTLVPFGTIPWRMHLLSALAATIAGLFIYGTIRVAARILFNPLAKTFDARFDPALIGGIFGALTFGLAVNVWQHAIHANPHIITAAFLAANLFFLTRWSVSDGPDRRWLYAFALTAGFGITHHPLTVMSFPAYLVFILAIRPAIWREWRTLLGMAAWGLLGLGVWLYFPLRSAMEPAFGPATMNTLSGFLDHVLARGLSESLPYFGPADIGGRAIVFWTLLRLQFSLPVILLAGLGFVWLVVDRNPAGHTPPATARPPAWKLAILYGLAFLGNYAFVMSLRAQDVMAYLLGLLVIVALLAGLGFYGLLVLTRSRFKLNTVPVALLATALFLLGPGLQFIRNAPHISLQDYTVAADYVSAVFERFDGRGEGAVLLNDWEHMTPIWYTQFVEGKTPNVADVRPELVSTAQPWLESVFAYLPGGPVYLSNFRREIVDAGFRLRPVGPFYQVVEPGDDTLPPGLSPAAAVAGDIEIVGYELPQQAVAPGEFVPLTLAMRSPVGTADYYVPIVRVGELSLPFTTDSHVVTPDWLPGEIIIERFDFALPHDFAAGVHPVSVGIKNLSTNTLTPLDLSLGDLTVSGWHAPPRISGALANYRQRVALLSATARAGRQRRVAIWSDPIQTRPGETVHLLLQWQSLAKAEESYTVFVHLIDPENRPLVALDYTPLGGSTPTHLWIPKWLPGQRMLDPYRLVLPADLAPGTYYIEVGLYEMVSQRRLHMADQTGNLIGDRLILGPLVVVR